VRGGAFVDRLVRKGAVLPAIAATDLERMRDELLFDGPQRARKLSRFWALLILAALIATAGVMTNSTATVIGAMIVAPLMTPMLGMVFSTVTVDTRNLATSFLLVVSGACVVVGLGWLLGHLTPIPMVAATNPQIAGRVDPTLGDLLAALATGAVGAFALVRDDVSDTLPGVAIAISLVPPLAVVGLTLESGAPKQALGALVLFLTNFGAILLMGLIVMAIYHVRTALGSEAPTGHTRIAVAVVVAFVVVLAGPLAADTERITSEQVTNSSVNAVASKWASHVGWQVVEVAQTESGVTVRAIGPLPLPNPQTLRQSLNANGLKGTAVQLELDPVKRVNLPAS
jgi:uncharacterized hydrophobic protein (TIGR00271 family)